MPIRQVVGNFKLESELRHVSSVIDYESWIDEYEQKRRELEEEILAAREKESSLAYKYQKATVLKKEIKKEMKKLKRAHAEEEYERSKEAYEECLARLRNNQVTEVHTLIKIKQKALSQLADEEQNLDFKYQNELVPIEGYRFYSEKFYTTSMLTPQEYQDILDKQERDPVLLMTDSSDENAVPTTRWYMFKGKFYRENEELTTVEIKALLLSREARRKKKIEKAMAYLEIHDHPTERAKRREPIPDDVKMFVWKRDGGRCVKCESREKLEFDHIIPLSKGGSNTARNIQLLCEKCNREKGGDLI